jgi:formylglycine-generating enzyme required for sulfatase activity
MGVNYAIVVGINNYSTRSSLSYAESDAESVRDCFIDELKFETVYFFAPNQDRIKFDNDQCMESSPTVGNFDIFLSRLFSREFLSADDNLWFFFAGHGCHKDSKDYLILQDTDSSAPEKMGLEVQDLAAKFCKSGAGNVVLFIDACRTTGRGNSPIQPAKQQGVIAFYACRENEEAQESKKWKAGVFTHVLLEGLRTGNCATVARLASYLEQEVPKCAHPDLQNPVLLLNSEIERYTLLFPEQATLEDIDKLERSVGLCLEKKSFRDAEKLLIQVLNANFIGRGGKSSDIINAIKKITKAELDSAQAAQNSNFLQEARRLAREARDRDPDKARELLLKALNHLPESVGNTDISQEKESLVASIEELVRPEENPKSASVRVLLLEAGNFWKDKEKEKATQKWIEVLRLSPGNQEALEGIVKYGVVAVVNDFKRWLSIPSNELDKIQPTTISLPAHSKIFSRLQKSPPPISLISTDEINQLIENFKKRDEDNLQAWKNTVTEIINSRTNDPRELFINRISFGLPRNGENLLSEDNIRGFRQILKERDEDNLQTWKDTFIEKIRSSLNLPREISEAVGGLFRTVENQLPESEIRQFIETLIKIYGNSLPANVVPQEQPSPRNNPVHFNLGRRNFLLVIGVIALIIPLFFKKQDSLQKPSIIIHSSTPKKTTSEELKFRTAMLDEKGVGNFLVASCKVIVTRIDESGDVKLNMVSIPQGKFLMGSLKEKSRYSREGPQREVSIKPFYMSQMPITQSQWRKVATTMTKIKVDLNSNPSKFEGDDLPVENISWEEAVEFCKRLSNFETGYTYRLPSEAEWEYACRAGTTTPFHFGETLTTYVANYRGTDSQDQSGFLPGKYGDGPEGEFRKQTTKVEDFPANAWGLYSMHGNVGEWCADRWHDNYKGSPIDGTAWEKNGIENKRVVRGGDWNEPPMRCRSASRAYAESPHKDEKLGFRVVCVPR